MQTLERRMTAGRKLIRLCLSVLLGLGLIAFSGYGELIDGLTVQAQSKPLCKNLSRHRQLAAARARQCTGPVSKGVFVKKPFTSKQPTKKAATRETRRTPNGPARRVQQKPGNLKSPIRKVRVPNIVGLTAAQAAQTLRQSGLSLATLNRPSKQRPGSVYKQSPSKGGIVKQGSRVTGYVAIRRPNDRVVVSPPKPGREVRRSVVPNLKGMNADQAKSALRGARLKVGRVTYKNVTGRPGTVYSQQPGKQTRVAYGTKVNVTVISGRVVKSPTAPVVKLVDVPQLVGMKKGRAFALLKSRGLKPVAQSKLSLKPAGTVLTQRPPAGTQLRPQRSVTFQYADPGDDVLPYATSLPNLVGRSKSKALDLLTKYRLKGRVKHVRTDRQAPGIVFRQKPAPVKRIASGDTVTIWVALKTISVVPDLYGMQQKQAEQTIQSAGLSVGRVQYSVSGEQPGTVSKQRPAKQKRVKKGSPVDFVVVKKKQPIGVVVPKVIGLDAAGAKSTISGRNLNAKPVYIESPRTPGIVYEQKPPPGTAVKAGSLVTYKIARPGEHFYVSKVPDLIRATQPGAVALLKRANLKGRVRFVEIARYPPGLVFAQSPNAGREVNLGSVVQFEIAKAPPLKVPDLIGKDNEQAERILVQHKLKGAPSFVPSNKRVGRVFAQTPVRGSPARAGDTVAYNVATAPSQEPGIYVGNYVGSKRDPAKGELRKKALRVKERTVAALEPSGVIVDHNPRNQTVSKGTVVLLTISDGSLVRMPDVVGMDQEQGREVLASVELPVLSQEVTSNERQGQILLQSAVANRAIARGTTVQLTISKGGDQIVSTPSQPPNGPSDLEPGNNFWWLSLLGVSALGGLGAFAYKVVKGGSATVSSVPSRVTAHWQGPTEPAQIDSHGDKPVKVTVTVSPVRAKSSPSVEVTKEQNNG